VRSRLALTILALVAASALCVALVELRINRTGDPFYRFLAWNLFLAWVPFGLAIAAYDRARRRVDAIVGVLLVFWLLFFPNAPYMLTDFIHLGDRHRLVDSLILASFAFTALALGFASMLLVQIVVTRKVGASIGWLVALGALFLASVGVYLGRVHRFNSWDVVARPRLVAWTMWQGFDDPFAHLHLLFFVVAGGGFLALAYVGLYGVADLVAALNGEDQRPVLLSKRQWPSRSSSSNPS
jgi:uncharacterized membrane protein